ncbi:oxidoreductase [Asanoa ishikariensis]|uniref:Propionate 3-nitronate monooxygenase n=1 Tax=Asanoa ishikariensis TaxID=137265 RepID=A0A1H3TH08_9ACTN|nr:nitronate monooxygenase [Asanoa ishikariensis]GIF62512.1 oxidoreductase [Asanoa ishikariensis]SDZ49111.1 nitroalkane oxidase [Asanoa ishikariensis]
MTTVLPDLALPVIAAPMAGGPGTPAFVVAAGRAGGMGFLAGGYQPPTAFAEEIATVTAAGVPFGVNLFAPNTVPVDAAAYRDYAALLATEAARFGVGLPPDPVEDDDAWRDKLEVLRQWPVPLVSFTFGLPPAADLALLRATGAALAQTVTSVTEARAAAEAGLDVLVVQAAAAGGHSGTFTPDLPVPVVPLPALVAEIRAAVPLPVIAAGGVGTAADVAAALGAGATLVAVGTVLLRAAEAGTSATHRAALADPARTTTVVTRAFTGRPARGLRNDFTDRYSAVAPAGYPALHTLTRPIRRAAAAAGDPERVHLWSGTGFRHATDDPVGTILARLAAGA